MKMLHPCVPKDLLKVVDVVALINSEDKIESVDIDGIDISGLKFKSLAIEESLIHKTSLLSTAIERFETKDCIFADCDFTASSLADSSWHAVEVIGARCSGLQLQNSVMKNVLFKGCKLELVNFRFSKLENIVFEDCIISDVDFYNATLKGIAFVGSSIENIEFSGAKLKDVDLTRAQIISVKGVNGFKGATISYEQLIFLTPYFAQEVGIIVKD